MQTKKKAITTLITAMLVLSFMTIQPASALSVTGIGSVEVGDEITVEVTGTTPGGLVRLYWDTVKAWDGKAGLLAEGYAVGTEANIDIVIPEAVAGQHYMIAKDVESGLTAYDNTVVILSKIELKPDKAIPGDTIDVSGTGFAGSTSVIVLYDWSILIAPTEDLLGGTWDVDGGSAILDNRYVDPGTVSIVVTDSAGIPVVVTFTDDGAGALGTITPGYEASSGTIDYVTGAVSITITPAVTAPIVSVDADYDYYDAVEKVSTSTDSVGSFSASLDVPDTAVPPDYVIHALDGEGNEADAILSIVESIILLDPDKGYIGSTVTVEGRGFTEDETVDIRWMMNGAYITVKDDYPIKSDGSFTTTIKVPLLPDPIAPGKDYTVRAIDSEGLDATETFTVVGPAKITLDPKKGKVDKVISITGVWFTENEKVTFTFDGDTLTTVPSPAYTGSKGSFIVTFEVPDVDVGTYTVKATDAEGVSATADFDVIILEVVVKTRATKYLQGDTVSIYADSSEPQVGVVLEITDPDGMIFWTKDPVNIEEEVDDWYFLYAYISVQLPSDGVLGSYNFTAYDKDDELLDTNLFTVAERPTMATVVDAVDELEDTVVNKLDDIEAAIAEIEIDFPDVQDDLDAILDELAALSDIETSLADIKTLAESAVDSAADASGSAEDAKTAAEGANAGVTGISMAVYAAVIMSIVAALASVIGVITIQRRIAS